MRRAGSVFIAHRRGRAVARLIAALLLALCGCAAGARAPDLAASPEVGSEASGEVRGRVALAPGAPPATVAGRLVVTWMTRVEADALRTGQLGPQLLRDLVTRSAVIGDVGLAREVSFTIHAPRGNLVLAAAVDVSHQGWAAIFGEGEGTLSGMSAPFELSGGGAIAPAIALTRQPARPPEERCAGERLTLEHLDAPEVAGTVGNATSRRACVRVPRDYDQQPARRYPVLYLLPGLQSDDQSALRYGVDPDGVIVVAVDTRSRTGSTYLTDNATNGLWDTFFTRDLIPFIDAHYRTLPGREARAVAGHSTGGFNAVSYGLRHPQLIGVIGASSPDALDLASWLGAGARPRPWIRDFQRVERALGGAGQFISYAAAWSPTPAGYDWPFDSQGRYIDSVLQRWIANSPAALLRDPRRAAALKRFSGHIYLTVGDRDEFDLHAPTVEFSRQLTAAGIAHELVITPGGHGNLAQRMAAIGRFCASKLAAAR